MFHHLLVVKTARGDFPVLVAETHSWTLVDGTLNQDGCHLLHSPLIDISWADHTDSTVQQNLCRLPEELQTTSLCFFTFDWALTQKVLNTL